MYFEIEELYEIRDRAISAGLQNKRNLLLIGILPEYIASLEQADTLGDQILLDLNAMNDAEPIIGGVVPLERWLRNAAYATSIHPEREKFFRERADRVRIKFAREAPGIDTRQERILFTSELLPYGFVAGALRSGGSVARAALPVGRAAFL